MNKLVALMFLLHVSSSILDNLQPNQNNNPGRQPRSKRISQNNYSNTTSDGQDQDQKGYFPDGNGCVSPGLLNHPKSNLTTRCGSGKTKPEEFVTFTYYNRKNNATHGVTFSLNSSAKVLVEIDNGKPLKLITHGWLNDGLSEICQRIKNSYLKTRDVSVIVIDWGCVAHSHWYFTPLESIESIAQYCAKVIEKIVDNGMNPKNIHLIGYSLGAHLSGTISLILKMHMKITIARVTGLDPSLPMIEHLKYRLDQTCADFVDVIHTSGGFFGIKDAIGHADFYPNGGVIPQPRCKGILEIFSACSHAESWKLFEESIEVFTEYSKCDSWTNFQLGKCNKTQMVPFGDPAPSHARGCYYLDTTNIHQNKLL
ncbi:lipase member H-B-like [Agrilus planipennis]|uniref:Lipase member H-B-like n=1 Tax=Agrilus planipennis TaxID=224129 RepID=A0A7F5R4X8_AGRPL|nr:lipase member H-B-like [Agrilus planipennis]